MSSAHKMLIYYPSLPLVSVVSILSCGSLVLWWCFLHRHGSRYRFRRRRCSRRYSCIELAADKHRVLITIGGEAAVSTQLPLPAHPCRPRRLQVNTNMRLPPSPGEPTASVCCNLSPSWPHEGPSGPPSPSRTPGPHSQSSFPSTA